jgi:2-C-methyl-D-erythritol 4-phosphate cytidylyltransferase
MNHALIVAAGRGTRMGPGMDKLFLEVGGAPTILHTWRRFDRHPEIASLTLVIRETLQPAFHELATRLNPTKPFQLVVGGAERQDSVWNGLQALPETAAIVAIHDGARPATSPETISRCLRAAHESGAAVAAQRATDTIKECHAGQVISRHLDRSRLWAVQTPQCFRVPLIREALGLVRTRNLTVTDDTAACELIGQPVHLVDCPEPNPKVTAPHDLPWVDLCLRSQTLT